LGNENIRLPDLDEGKTAKKKDPTQVTVNDILRVKIHKALSNFGELDAKLSK
jgi:tRNA A37 threonylcarbamoyladenosine dehydratase